MPQIAANFANPSLWLSQFVDDGVAIHPSPASPTISTRPW
jgi:hypothetical protein